MNAYGQTESTSTMTYLGPDDHRLDGTPEENEKKIARLRSVGRVMPDIEVGHVVTPTADSELGAKGAGEAGTVGALPAVMNAVNHALASVGAAPIDMPATSERVWQALQNVPKKA